MNTKNNNETDIQNRFSAYLKVSIKNFKNKYLYKKRTIEFTEVPLDFEDYLVIASENDAEMNIIFEKYIADNKLIDAICKLTPREREIVIKRAINEKTFKKIAEELDLSLSNTKMIYRRSINKLRKEFK